MLFFIFAWILLRTPVNYVSIHLMLFFIPWRYYQDQTSYHVSIHLMLFFISMGTKFKQKGESFNTSHVILYRCLSSQEVRDIVSIHLMLFFIINHRDRHLKRLICFNTSHVILYPDVKSVIISIMKFQYISCYSLSIKA